MNYFIGDPNEAIKNYASTENHRPISEMTVDECSLILDMATDDGEWKTPAVCNVEIESAHSNFVEGTFYLGKPEGTKYNFTIRYDGTVNYFILGKDENNRTTIDKMEVYSFTNVILLMMKMNFGIINHLLKTV